MFRLRPADEDESDLGSVLDLDERSAAARRQPASYGFAAPPGPSPSPIRGMAPSVASMLRQRPAGAERVPEYDAGVVQFAADEDDSPTTESRVVSWLERQESAPPALGERRSSGGAARESTPKQPWRTNGADQVPPPPPPPPTPPTPASSCS